MRHTTMHQTTMRSISQHSSNAPWGMPPGPSNFRLRVRVSSASVPDVPGTAMSAGIRINRYDVPGALAAVRNKSFSCTMCGKCCTLAADAEVWVTTAEVAAMAHHLNLQPERFTEQYCQPHDKVPGWRLLQSQLVNTASQQQQHQPDALQPQPQQEVCALLDPASNSCSVYPVRPLQCSTYPWWPELMAPGNWQQEKVLMCEGLDHPDAPDLDTWYAAQQLQRATEHALAFEAAKPAGWLLEGQLYPPAGSAAGSSSSSSSSSGDGDAGGSNSCGQQQ